MYDDMLCDEATGEFFDLSTSYDRTLDLMFGTVFALTDNPWEQDADAEDGTWTDDVLVLVIECEDDDLDLVILDPSILDLA